MNKIMCFCAPTATIFVISLLNANSLQATRLPIAAFVRPEERDDGVANMLQFAHEFLANNTASQPKITVYTDVLTDTPNNTYAIWQQLCNRLASTGAMTLLGTGDGTSFGAYNSLSSAHHVPFINWALSSWLLEREPISGGGASAFAVNMRPPIDELITDIILARNWTHVTYMHTGIDAALNLQNIFIRLNQRIAAENIGFHVYTELLPLPEEPSEYSEFLHDFHRDRFNSSTQREFHVIVDVPDSGRLGSFLSALHTNSLQAPDKFHYLMADFGLTPQDQTRIQRGFLNMTVLQLVQRKSPFYLRLQNEFGEFLMSRNLPDDSEIPADLALVFDAVLVAQLALNQTLSRVPLFDNVYHSGNLVENRGHPGIYCRQEQAEHAGQAPLYETFEKGAEIADRIRNMHLLEGQTLTGDIKFDERGIRTDFTVEVFDYSFNEQSADSQVDSVTWQQGRGFVLQSPQPTESVREVFNHSADPTVRIITTVLVNPHAMWKPDIADSNKTGNLNDKLEGFCIDLISKIAKKIGFEYRIKLVSDGKYGGVKSDGSWNGMVGELLRGEAHVAVAPLTISRQRERVVDFSKPFMVTGITIMIKKPDKAEFSVFAFMHPLSDQIWVFICLSYLGVSVVIFLVSRFSPYEWQVEENSSGGFSVSNDFSVYNCLWFTLAALMHQGTDILPRSVAGRIASSAWWFFTMIMMASYTANLAAFLTSEKLEASIDSVDKLAAQSKIKYGIQGHGSTAAFFEHSSVPTYQKMWQFMSTQVPPVFTTSYDEGIKRVRDSKGGYAFLLEGTANEYANTRKPCDTMKVGEPLNSVGYGVATPFGSDLRQPINLAILDLQEKGELKKMEIKWWYDRGQCEQGPTKTSQSVSLNLSKVAGIFYILIAGMVLAMMAACGELFYRGQFDEEQKEMATKLMNFAKQKLTGCEEQCPQFKHIRAILGDVTNVPLMQLGCRPLARPLAQLQLTRSNGRRADCSPPLEDAPPPPRARTGGAGRQRRANRRSSSLASTVGDVGGFANVRQMLRNSQPMAAARSMQPQPQPPLLPAALLQPTVHNQQSEFQNGMHELATTTQQQAEGEQQQFSDAQPTDVGGTKQMRPDTYHQSMDPNIDSYEVFNAKADTSLNTAV